MKRQLSRIIIVVIVLAAVSCNSHFRFIIDPVPGIPIVVQPVNPGAGHIWIGGEWYWNGRTYMWRDGYWTWPLQGHVWVPGRWKKSSAGWFWVPGYWRR